MQIDLKQYVAGFLLLALMSLQPGDVHARGQSRSLTTHASGKGTLKIGSEAFNVNAAVVKLMEDGNAEISLLTEITVFVKGKWTTGEQQNVVNLELTEGAAGSLQGDGKIFLRDDGKSLDRIVLHAANKTTRRTVEVDFEANKS